MRYSSLRRVVAISLLLCAASNPNLASELRFFLRSEPSTLDPFKAEDEFSDLIRYLTGGVLIRLNRQTQRPQPELATSWKLSKDGRELRLQLRHGVKFSDGTPFDAADVAHTFRLLFAPELRSATADAFRAAGMPPVVRVLGPLEVSILFSRAIAAAEGLLDQVAIVSSRARPGTTTSLGPYTFAAQKQGISLLLKRNPNYWKKDASGRSLPLIDELRIGFQGNRELEALAFRRGEIDLVSSIDARTY
ncbi:MAG: hypothetical protein H7039_05565, partial [Bryobacteraceae bacterium]|nr:hypothetical protein [Bryobacteraceae bacterium]